jgi:hypothetical protein
VQLSFSESLLFYSWFTEVIAMLGRRAIERRLFGLCLVIVSGLTVTLACGDGDTIMPPTATGGTSSGGAAVGGGNTGGRATGGSGTGASGGTFDAFIGTPCSSGAACTTIPTGYCAAAGVCTRTCQVHSDCGCPTGTTEGMIMTGGCEAACVTGSSDAGTTGYCLRVCSTNTGTKACGGTTTCQSGGLYDVCL